jgi:hypothetical protein
MAEKDAHTVDAALLKGDRKMVATLVAESAVIQDDYSKCTNEKNKEKLAMEYHTTMRSFNEGRGRILLRRRPRSRKLVKLAKLNNNASLAYPLRHWA